MAGLSEEEIVAYKREFNSFDADGDGTISAEELANVLRSFGDEVSEDDVRKVINTFDIDQNGSIEFNEFLIMMAHKEAGKLDGSTKGKSKGQRNMQSLIKKAFAKRAQIRKTFESFDKVRELFVSFIGKQLFHIYLIGIIILL